MPDESRPKGFGSALLVSVALVLAVVSLSFHTSVPYLGSTRYQAWGSVMFFAGLLVTFLLIASSRQDDNTRWRSLIEKTGWLWAALLAASLFFHLSHILIPPLFMDEKFWLDQARSILEWKNFHPSGFIGDQPANFQAWPVALFLLLTHSPVVSVRLPGVLYLVGMSVFLYRLLFIAGGRLGATLACLFSAFSIWTVNLGVYGWNNVTIVPLLTVWPLAKFVEAITFRCERSLLWCALALGLAVTTLYVPLTVAALLLPAVLFMVRRFSWGTLVRFALVFLLVAAPTVGKVVRYPTRAVGRHVEFASGSHAAAGASLWARYAETAVESARELLPESLLKPLRLFDRGLWGCYLEATTFLFLFVGSFVAAAGRFGRREAERWLLAAAIWLFVTMAISNPGLSVWRRSGLQAALFGLAALGAAAALTFAGRRLSSPRFRAWLLPLLILLHGAFFFRAYVTWARHQTEDHDLNLETTARMMVRTVTDLRRQGYAIAVPVRFLGPLIRAASYKDFEITEYKGLEEAARAIAADGPVALAVVPQVQDDETRDHLRTLAEKREWVAPPISVRDQAGRVRAVFFLLQGRSRPLASAPRALQVTP
jgi:hypothetical protein